MSVVPTLLKTMANAAPARAAGLEGVPSLGHVFVLMGENQGLNKLTQAHSPYLTGTLKPRSAYLTRYTGVTLGGSLAKLDLWGPGLGLLIPVALVALLGWRSFCRSDEVRLVGWSLAWAMVLLVTVALGGPRANEGNIGRVAFGVAWVGYLYMVRWVLELARGWRTWSTWPLRQRVATPLVGA